MIKVCKFGGTSMASKASFMQVAKIVNAEEERRYVVVSAPGKRFSGDEKVTDLLYKAYAERKCREKTAIGKIRQRFNELAKELKLKLDVNTLIDVIEENIANSDTADYAASRGEYLSARLFAEYVGYEFVDACEIIKFNENGSFNSELTNDLVAKRLAGCAKAVIGGFYGSMPDGSIKTFSRGGSDISGAIIARGVMANVYENWTDVNGFFTTDPRIVRYAKNIDVLSYEELRELAYMGANVLHPESIFPVQYNNIPINIRNTFEPTNRGTMIVADTSKYHNAALVTGIAGKKGYTTILIKKAMMNNELGFGRKVLSVLEYNGISFEHMPTGIDTMSVICATADIPEEKEKKVLDEIRGKVNPDILEITHDLALIAIVGHGMANQKGTAAKVFKALCEADVNIRMIDQGSSEMNIIVGVEACDLDISINAIYNEFFM